MVDQLINWANNNPGFVAILLFIIAIPISILGYFIKRLTLRDRSGKTLIQKQKGGDNSTNIQTGRDTNTRK